MEPLTLTVRAERALLGAMIADPELFLRLEYLRAEDFAGSGSRRVYRAIENAAADHPPGAGEYWRDAIVACSAPGTVTRAELDALAAQCPEPRHGRAYGTMVAEASAVRSLHAMIRELAGRVGQLRMARWHPSRGADGLGTEQVARHLDKVIDAIRRHTDGIGSRGEHAALPEELRVADGQRRREEIVLAALLTSGPARGRAIAEGVSADAFGGSYRRAAFEVLSAMHKEGRPVDALTADWELAAAGLPLFEKPAGADAADGETYASWLAGIWVDPQQGITAALSSRLRGGRSTVGRRGKCARWRPGRAGRGAGLASAGSLRHGKPGRPRFISGWSSGRRGRARMVPSTGRGRRGERNGMEGAGTAAGSTGRQCGSVASGTFPRGR